LSRLPKGQTEKLVLAWWLYGQTTVRRRWVAEQLRMGYETRVSQAVGLVWSLDIIKRFDLGKNGFFDQAAAAPTMVW